MFRCSARSPIGSMRNTPSTLIVDQATADQAAFLPGDGRGFYVGVKSRFCRTVPCVTTKMTCVT